MTLNVSNFNVLDRHLDVARDHLLEASAGTGKTFSIENIVVRLLIEKEDPCTIDRILVVTFTRAATRDLKMRIRANIEKAVASLKECNLNSPDYLCAIIEQGTLFTTAAIKRLERALFTFDQAQIFTIHSFCSRMLRENILEGDIGLDAISENKQVDNEQLFAIIRDFFRTELTTKYSQAQLNIVLKEHKYDIAKLEKALLKYSSGCEVIDTRPYNDLLAEFNAIMSTLGLEKEKILADYFLQSPRYKQLKNHKGAEEKLEFFAHLFTQQSWSGNDLDRLISEGLILVEALDPGLLKAKKEPVPRASLHYPDLLERLLSTLGRLLKEASSYRIIFARMVHHCQLMVQRYLAEEEKFRHDDFLRLMAEGLDNPEFVEKIQGRYRAAIIDEFQDTDPLQWEIFKRLFLGKRLIYLVGDPKQSIYAFRQADIYTYLQAAQQIGTDNHASLDVNFRSQPSLVTALNTIFGKNNNFLTLPRLKTSLEYPHVKFSKKTPEKEFSDAFGSVHFFIAQEETAKIKFPLEDFEERFYFPFMLEEIVRLQRLDGFQFSQCAILIRDQFQGNRLAEFFRAYNVPVALQKSSSLADSPALLAIREVLQAVINQGDESALRLALGGELIAWTHHEVRALSDSSTLEKTLDIFRTFHRLLVAGGFALFFQKLMKSSFGCKQIIAEKMLTRKDGDVFHQELSQIAELLAEQQSQTQCGPEGLLLFIDEFTLFDSNNDERIKKRRDPHQEAVQILTLHSSKGLEFDIVFALGLMNQTPVTNLFIPMQKGNKQQLVPITEDNQELFAEHCLEGDAEKMRQLYVALTRARYRLYIPVAFALGSKPAPKGCASPMELFIAGISEPHEPAYEVINKQNSQGFLSFLEDAAKKAKITYSLLNETKKKTLSAFVDTHEIALCAPEKVNIVNPAKYMLSFTQLSKHTSTTASRPNLKPPHDHQCVIKTPHTLPSGAMTGIIMHEIFEKLPWKKIKDIRDPALLIPYVTPYLAGTEFVGWAQVTCEMVFAALSCPLEGFSLLDVDPKKMYRETEFLYPLKSADGFLKGVIDFVFEHNGKYYIVDWKTNWLGDQGVSYQKEGMEAAMREHDYYLQGKLYTDALEKFLHVMGISRFSECFGGVFYLFVRGIDGRTPNQGVLHLC